MSTLLLQLVLSLLIESLLLLLLLLVLLLVLVIILLFLVAAIGILLRTFPTIALYFSVQLNPVLNHISTTTNTIITTTTTTTTTTTSTSTITNTAHLLIPPGPHPNNQWKGNRLQCCNTQ
jgi:hypothetical protein